MRCPHCASPKVEAGRCRQCGGSLEVSAEQPVLEALEPTAYAPQAPRPEALGAGGSCKRCGAARGSERFCARCGYDTAPEQEGADEVALRCLQCGVPNPRSRARCMSCGERMLAEEELDGA